VKFVGVRDNDAVVAIALNPEITAEEEAEPEDSPEGAQPEGAASEVGEPAPEDQAPADPEPDVPGVEEDEQ
jgi:hypothetical protein